MKVIPVEAITAVSASNEDASYPASNLLNSRPKKVWKGTGAAETLTFTLTGTTSGLAIFNTNATGASFVLSDPNGVTLESGVVLEAGAQLASVAPNVTQIVALNGTDGAFMVQWQEITGSLTLEVSLVNNSGEVLFAGVATGGEVYSAPDPELGMTEDIDDQSIDDEYPNGISYTKDGDSLRVFNIEAIMERDDAFHNFIYSVAKVVHKNYRAWLITDLNNSRWLVYVKFSRLPKGAHNHATRSRVTFELREGK